MDSQQESSRAVRALRKKDPKVENVISDAVGSPRRGTRRNSTSTPTIQSNTPDQHPITPLRRSRRLSQTNESVAPPSALMPKIFAVVEEEDDEQQQKEHIEEKENYSLQVNSSKPAKKSIAPSTQKLDSAKKISPDTPTLSDVRNSKRKAQKAINDESVGEIIDLVTPLKSKEKKRESTFSSSTVMEDELVSNQLNDKNENILTEEMIKQEKNTEDLLSTPGSSKIKNESHSLSAERKMEEATTEVKKTPDLKNTQNYDSTPGSSKRTINNESLLLSAERKNEKASVEAKKNVEQNDVSTPVSSKRTVHNESFVLSAERKKENAATEVKKTPDMKVIIKSVSTPAPSKRTIHNESLALSSERKNEKATAEVKKTPDIKGIIKSVSTPVPSKRTIHNESLALSSERKNENATAEVKKTPDIKGIINYGNTPESVKKIIADNNIMLSSLKVVPDIKGILKTPTTHVDFNNKSSSESCTPEFKKDINNKEEATSVTKKVPDIVERHTPKHIALDGKEKSVKDTVETPRNSKNIHFKERSSESSKESKGHAKKYLFTLQSDAENINGDEGDNHGNDNRSLLMDKPQVIEVKILAPLNKSHLPTNATYDKANEGNKLPDVSPNAKVESTHKTKTISFSESKVEDKQKVIYPTTPARFNIRSAQKRNLKEINDELCITRNDYESTDPPKSEKMDTNGYSPQTEEVATHKAFEMDQSSLVSPIQMETTVEETNVSLCLNISEFNEDEASIGNTATVKQDDSTIDYEDNDDNNEIPLFSEIDEEKVYPERNQPVVAASEEKEVQSLAMTSWIKTIKMSSNGSNSKIDKIKPEEVQYTTAENHESKYEEMGNGNIYENECEEEDNEETNTCSFIIEEARVVNDYASGDSMDEEERQVMKENEIGDYGESIESMSDEDGEDDDYEKDSFIVSDDDDELEQEGLMVEEEEEVKINDSRLKYKRIMLMSDESNEEEDQEHQTEEKESNEQQQAEEQNAQLIQNSENGDKLNSSEKVLSVSLTDKVVEMDKKLMSFSIAIGIEDKKMENEMDAQSNCSLKEQEQIHVEQQRNASKEENMDSGDINGEMNDNYMKFVALKNRHSFSIPVHKNNEGYIIEQSRLRRRSICGLAVDHDIEPSSSFIDVLQEKKRLTQKRKRASKGYDSDADIEEDYPRHVHKKSKLQSPLSDTADNLLHDEEERVVQFDNARVPSPIASKPEVEQNDAEIYEAAKQAMFEKLKKGTKGSSQYAPKSRRNSATKLLKNISPEKEKFQATIKKRVKRLTNKKDAVDGALKASKNLLLPKKKSSGDGKTVSNLKVAKKRQLQKQKLEKVSGLRKKRGSGSKRNFNKIKTASGYFVEMPISPLSDRRPIEEFQISTGIMRVEPISPVHSRFRIEPISPHCFNLAGQGKFLETRSYDTDGNSYGSAINLSSWYVKQ